MVSLMLLKQLYDISDEQVCKSWVQNPYWQFFSGEVFFSWSLPCDPSDLTYFRDRIGKAGVEIIFSYSVLVHGEDAKEKEVLLDTTVQEKNITFPTDTKQQMKIIKKCREIALKEQIQLRQSYKRKVKEHLLNQRFKKHAKNRKKAAASARKIKTIAGRLVRELEKKLNAERLKAYQEELGLFKQVLGQKKESTHKIYSLHEKDVLCISKGKDHKKYEFGSKASFGVTKNSGIIVSALDARNQYDGHTVPMAIEQIQKTTKQTPNAVICDRGYGGKKEVMGVKVLIPRPGKNLSAYEKTKIRKMFRRRASVEPIIGHMKADHGLDKCYLKGIRGDEINLMMAAAAFNLKKYMRKTRKRLRQGLKIFLQSFFWLKKLPMSVESF
jgi:IS5 family transposase